MTEPVNVNITIDDEKLSVPQGSMIIEAADNAGITIPRFCYHKKLSVAANCRMCLVDVVNSRKPLPACATPVADGMVVFTKSPRALSFQKAVMEFLLINHPLDCPICDQGGECELQDLAMGYGKDVSRYNEGKRSVRDKDIGPLIETDLTRCIHCTRCVRFGTEVAGLRELGMINRGEHMEISTFLESAVDSELSGNVIDLCPVGALTNKPFRYRARPWEMRQMPLVSPHDCVGSNLFAHVRGGNVLRMVPRENEAVNEVWISDRDRYSCDALNSDNRATTPMIKNADGWHALSWEEAFEHLLQSLRDIKRDEGADKIAALASPGATTEELYLLQKLMRGLGSNHIDHRLQEADFAYQDAVDSYPRLNCELADLTSADVVLLVGTDLRHEAPLLNHRIRQATLAGAKVLVINPKHFDFNYALTLEKVGNYEEMWEDFLAIANHVLNNKKASAIAAEMAQLLAKAQSPVIILGELAALHPDFSLLFALMQNLMDKLNAKGGYVTRGANSAGAWLAGAIPHRGHAGAPVSAKGKHALEILAEESGIKALFLLNTELTKDTLLGQSAAAVVKNMPLVVAMTPFVTADIQNTATLILPIAAFAESSGTYVNITGKWQSFQGVAQPKGEARPAWKVLRVLGNLLSLPGFDYVESTDILKELKAYVATMKVSTAKLDIEHLTKAKTAKAFQRLGTMPIYATDMLARHSPSLGKTRLMQDLAQVKIACADADALKIKDNDEVIVRQQGSELKLPVRIDPALAKGLVELPQAVDACLGGHASGEIQIAKC